MGLTHMDNVCRFAGEHGQHIAMLYDKLQRQQIARRAQNKDPELDVNKDLATLDKQTLEIAKSRVDVALLQGVLGKAQPAGSPATASAAEAALAKQTAAAQTVQQEAEMAIQRLKVQQDNNEANRNSNRDRKNDYWDKKRQGQEEAAKGKQGKKGNTTNNWANNGKGRGWEAKSW